MSEDSRAKITAQLLLTQPYDILSNTTYPLCAKSSFICSDGLEGPAELRVKNGSRSFGVVEDAVVFMDMSFMMTPSYLEIKAVN